MMRIADSKGFQLTDGKSSDWRPSWSQDGKYLYFVSGKGGVSDLWRLRIEENGASVSMPEQVTTGLEIRNAAFSPNGT
jgi:Tol biopolymer transport system component